MGVKWLLGEEYRGMEKEIEELQEEIARRWNRLRSPRVATLTQERHGKGRIADPAEAICAVVEMERTLEAKIEALCALRRQAEDVLAALPVRERRLLRLRYFHGYGWDVIAERMNYDESTCRRIHRQLARQL